MEPERQLYDRLFKPIYKFFHYKYVPHEENEDLCQEVFLRLFQKYSPTDLPDEEAIKLAYTIARNVYREWVRRSIKTSTVSLDFDKAEPEDEAWPAFWVEASEDEVEDGEAADREEKEVLLKAMDTLPEKLATVIRMRFLEDKTRAEVAQELGCKEKHVHVYQRRALEQLRKSVSLSA